jgi:DNA polymerase III delta prime subunit
LQRGQSFPAAKQEIQMTVIKIPQPKYISDLIFSDTATQKRVAQYASCKRTGNIILHGPKGTGKSTAARCIIQGVFDTHNNPNPVPELHAKQFADNTQMQAKIYGEWNFQTSWGIKFPYFIINEVEQLGAERLRQLRCIMDGTEVGNFIFTTNNIYALDEPFLDRCDDIEMPPIDINEWRPKVYEWLKVNSINVESDLVERMLITNTGTIRDLKRIVEDIACEYN